MSEVLKRDYHKKVRLFRETYNIELLNFDSATPEMVCILSKNEFDVGLRRSQIEQDNECYFIPIYLYEQIKDI